MTMTHPKVTREFLETLSKRMADEGKVIEAGWMALRALYSMDDDQVHDMRMAYMAGAQHLFSTLTTIMDAGEEITEADLRRMDMIAYELNAWAAEMKAREGRASRG